MFNCAAWVWWFHCLKKQRKIVKMFPFWPLNLTMLSNLYLIMSVLVKCLKKYAFLLKESEDLLPQSKGTKSGDILKFLIRHLRNSYLASLQTLGTPWKINWWKIMWSFQNCTWNRLLWWFRNVENSAKGVP